MTVGNTGGSNLDWTIIEDNNVQPPQPPQPPDAPVVSLAKAGPDQPAVPQASGPGGDGLARPPAGGPHVVLYDQYNQVASNGTSSQNFEAANDAFDNELADDFVVPAGQTWNVDLVEVDGIYFNGPGPAASVNVVFYTNSGTLPDTVVTSYPAVAVVDTAGDFAITLTPAAVLPAGTYWVSVVANMNFTPTASGAGPTASPPPTARPPGATPAAGSAHPAPPGGHARPPAASPPVAASPTRSSA